MKETKQKRYRVCVEIDEDLHRRIQALDVIISRHLLKHLMVIVPRMEVERGIKVKSDFDE